MRARVLLTGAAGLIGRQTVAPLKAAGFEVVAVSRAGPVAGAARTLRADLLDGEARRALLEEAGADHLLHLAWYGGPGRWNSARNADWGRASLDLVAEFAARGGRRALCVGSCAEYDWSAADVLGEESPLAPKSAYARAKAETGRALLAGRIAPGVETVWARVFFCYGPGEPEGRLLGDLLAGLSQGREVPCTDGGQIRDFMHAADIGRALATVLAGDLEGAVNIASGQPVRVRNLIETTARLMGRPELIRFGALSRPEGDAPRVVADVARLAATGFRPGFDLESGLRDVVRHFREAGR